MRLSLLLLTLALVSIALARIPVSEGQTNSVGGVMSRPTGGASERYVDWNSYPVATATAAAAAAVAAAATSPSLAASPSLSPATTRAATRATRVALAVAAMPVQARLTTLRAPNRPSRAHRACFSLPTRVRPMARPPTLVRPLVETSRTRTNRVMRLTRSPRSSRLLWLLLRCWLPQVLCSFSSLETFVYIIVHRHYRAHWARAFLSRSVTRLGRT